MYLQSENGTVIYMDHPMQSSYHFESPSNVSSHEQLSLHQPCLLHQQQEQREENSNSSAVIPTYSWNEEFLDDFLGAYLDETMEDISSSLSVSVHPEVDNHNNKYNIKISTKNCNNDNHDREDSPCDSQNTTTESSCTSTSSKSNSSSTNNDGSNQVSKKRKRRRYYDMKDEHGNWIIPHVPLPRIPKSDIRRNYALFFTNVFNSGDKELLQQFLEQMFPEEHLFRFGRGGRNYRLALKQRDLLFSFCYENMQMAPNVVFAFDAHQIRVRSDGTATLSGHFHIKGTTIVQSPYEEKLAFDESQMSPSFRFHGDEIVFIGTSADNIDQNADTCNDNTAFSINYNNPNDYTNSTRIWKEERRLLSVDDKGPLTMGHLTAEDFSLYSQPKEVEFEIRGVFTMQLDTSARIYGMELVLQTDSVGNVSFC